MTNRNKDLKGACPSGIYVYEICYPDGTPFYVGLGRKKRALRMYGRTRWYQAIVEKIRRENEEPVIRFFPVQSNEEAAELEVRKILLYGRRDLGTGILVNLHPGGFVGGAGWTEEQRKAMSDRYRGVKRSPETIARMSMALKGRVGTNLGRKWSDETKRKMGLASRGRWHTEERRQRIGNEMRGRVYDHDTLDKMSEAQKQVSERHSAGDFTRKRKYKYERAFERGELSLEEAWTIHLSRIENRSNRGRRSTWTCLPPVNSGETSLVHD